MRLIIAEKPSVAGAIAAVVNAKQKQNGYTEIGFTLGFSALCDST